MKKLAPLLLAATLLGGCEPAPSTPLAPEQKLPDVSKMTDAEKDALIQKSRGDDRR
ncbi:MAG: hypothetical protein ACO1SV_14395 [Fimbriimonas sp.]